MYPLNAPAVYAHESVMGNPSTVPASSVSSPRRAEREIDRVGGVPLPVPHE